MSAADQPFTASSHERRKLLREKIVRRLMLASALALIIPVVTVIVYLFVKAAPVLSWDYIFQNPGPLGKTGGIWLPLMGTFYLVLVSLALELDPDTYGEGFHLSEKLRCGLVRFGFGLCPHRLISSRFGGNQVWYYRPTTTESGRHYTKLQRCC